MRNIINISMPASTKKEMTTYAKEAQYASVSELVRDMWRDWKRNQLLASLRASQKEFKDGKAKKFTSFRDMR